MHQPVYQPRDEYMIDLINQCDFTNPPAEFIECAKVIYFEGDPEIIDLDQLKTVIAGRALWYEMGIENVKLKLDIEYIISEVTHHADRILVY
jgi:hypothetical protein